MKTTFKVIVLGFVSGLAGSYTGFHYFVKPAKIQQESMGEFRTVNFTDTTTVAQVASPTPSTPALAEDFSEAASRATPSVVYINSISQGVTYSTWDWFFGEGPGQQTQVSSGSGVIFTADGYISCSRWNMNCRNGGSFQRVFVFTRYRASDTTGSNLG